MISVLIITRDRPALLQKCLASVRRELPADTQVVVVVNGPDETSSTLLETAPVETISLPRPLPPGEARNAGLSLLKGEWSFFVDDDAELPPGYYQHWLRALEVTPAAQVLGGPDQPRPEASGLERAVSLALSSGLCAGATSQRHRRQRNVVRADETVLTSCNLWVRSHWWLQGLRFPSDFRRGEETVLLTELRKKTNEVWSHGELSLWHARRTQLKPLLHASFLGGQFRAKFLRQSSGPWWFWLPSVFVLLHLSLLRPGWFATLAVIWLGAVLPVTFYLTLKERRMSLWPHVVFLHWALPFSYGVGFLSSMVLKR